MFQTAGYPAHPSYFDYRTPPRTPTTPGQQSYYSPRHFSYAATPPKGHARRATGDYGYSSVPYTTPRKSTYYTQPEYVSPAAGYASAQSTSQRQSDYVSRSARDRREQEGPPRHHTRRATDGGSGGVGAKSSSRKTQRDTSGSGEPSRYSTRTTSQHHQQQFYVYTDDYPPWYDELRGCYDYEYADEYLPRYEVHEARPPPYKRQPSLHHQEPERRQRHYHYHPFEQRADRPPSHQVPIYTSAGPTEPSKTSRPRRASHAATSKPTTPRYHDRDAHEQQQRSSAPPPRRPTTSSREQFTYNTAGSKPAPQQANKTSASAEATAADARRAGIPAGYSTKNWDPTEEPILLLGSVFDANSLGKWIYDWTVFYYGAGTPLSEVAGELWLLLIQLAGKIKRAEECLPRIRRTDRRELVEDFLESGERLWQRFSKLLKICEGFMWKVARKENAAAKRKRAAASKAEKDELDAQEQVRMGRSSGCEFVDAIFGIDREMPRTEKLMTGMRLWSMRFDANCEEVLRDPSR